MSDNRPERRSESGALQLGPETSRPINRVRRFGIVAAVLAASLAIPFVACEGRKGEPSGLGNYKFGTMTRANMHEGNCQPTELTDGRKAVWCFALPPIKVGKRIADVDAYFLGSDPPPLPDTATKEQLAEFREAQSKLPLIELQLKVRGCDEYETEQWMSQRFGKPDVDSKPTRKYWHNSFLWAAALLPSEPGRCVIHLLPVSEGAEIERLKQK
jgi:hypothetical protein